MLAFGEQVNTPEAMTKLANMAKWGSGGVETYYKAASQLELLAELGKIVGAVPFDPCCSSIDCNSFVEPFCGDGIVNGPEERDDGNDINGDGCSAWCTIEPEGTSSGSTTMEVDPETTGESTGSTTEVTTTGETTEAGGSSSGSSSSGGEAVTTGEAGAASTGSGGSMTGGSQGSAGELGGGSGVMVGASGWGAARARVGAPGSPAGGAGMMRRRRSWAALGLQGGLLAGVGLAFFGGVQPLAEAAPECALEGQCVSPKPMLLIVADYSTSMNTPFGGGLTRWQATVAAVQTIMDDQNGYLQGHAILGLMRFGHDPNVDQGGTKIAGDLSAPPLVDGQAIDVPFYDVNDPNKAYSQCNGEAIKKAWDPDLGGAVPSPLGGKLVGVESWTKGALDRAYATIQQTWADHPNEAKKRKAAVLLITDGEWTDPIGVMKLAPADQNPALTALEMYGVDGIPTYVVAIGEAVSKPFADELAAAGGTGQSIDAVTPQALVMGLQAVVEDFKQDVLQPGCQPGMPRIMVLLDASSSMLNIMSGTQAGKMGETGWDEARAALAGNNSLFDEFVNGNQKLENVVHLGLAVFGHNSPQPGEQKLLVDYGPCTKDNFAWALDPMSSCVAPGCNDPYSGPPITWTFQDGSMIDPPGFPEPTISHMPRCDKSAQLPNACVGSGTYTHLGLQLVDQNIAAYKAKCADPKFPYPCDEQTTFLNVLITDGVYNSTDAQVKAGLEGMFAKGIKTFVIAFGDLLNTQEAMAKLTNMAAWGSGGTEPYYKAADQMQLQVVLAQIVEGIQFDPCCSGFNCQSWPPPPPCTCGNGVVEACPGFEPDPFNDEECDDGNNLDGDGCSALCKIEPGDSSSGGSTTDAVTDTETSGGSTESTSSGGSSSSGGETTDGSSSGGSSSSGGEVVTTGEGTTSTGEASSGDGTTEGATGGGGGGEDGCGCAADRDGSRGWLVGLLALGLVRRRVRGRGAGRPAA